MKSDFHESVLKKEAIEGLNIKENGIYVDATLGRAGHSKEILSRLTSGRLICIDQDDEAIEYSITVLGNISNHFKIVRNNFRNLELILNLEDAKKVDGILFDLGVSSPQFDEDYRGFSYRSDAPLDMRMDRNNPLTAKYIVNNYSLNELNNIFRNYGEEKYSYSIAKNICKHREKKEIETTLELVEIIKEAKPKSELKKKGHPAKQIFQALRIEVNDELNALEEGLDAAIRSLKVGGRVVVITFHSLEDKIVKNLFKKYAVIEGNRHNDYLKVSEIETPDYEIINKKVIVASEEELEQNRRSKSAKLRILERKK